MIKVVITVALACASMHAQVALEPPSTAAESASSVVQWNRNVLPVLSTPGAQAGTIHLMRGFAKVQFRLGAPATLTNSSYAEGFNKMGSVGIGRNTTVSVAASTGQFWNSANQNYRNGITQTATVPHRLTIAQIGRLFTLPNVTLGGGVSGVCDVKYRYDSWRPMAALRAGDTENSRDTVPNLYWVPGVGDSGPDPSYPGAYAVIGPFHFQSGLTTLLRRLL